jgi:hypothetical protein
MDWRCRPHKKLVSYSWVRFKIAWKIIAILNFHPSFLLLIEARTLPQLDDFFAARSRKARANMSQFESA